MRYDLRTFMRLLLLPIAAAVLALALGGCVVSTPDTADSGTGFHGELKWPFGCCPEKGE